MTYFVCVETTSKLLKCDTNDCKNYKFKSGSTGFTTDDYLLEAKKETLMSWESRPSMDLPSLLRSNRIKVYISLTTTPSRIQFLHHVLDLLDLSIVENILLCIPIIFSRDNTTYDFPENLLQRYQPKLKIIRTPEDYGPMTKLVGATKYLKNNHSGKGNAADILITIDDDTGYGRSMVSELVFGCLSYPHTIIGGHGAQLEFFGISPFAFPFAVNSSLSFTDQKPTFAHPVDVTEAFAAVAFRLSMVDEELLLAFAKRNIRSCFLADDLVISYVMAYQGFAKLQWHTSYFSVDAVRQYHFGFRLDALSWGADAHRYEQSHIFTNYYACYQTLIRSFYHFQEMRWKSREEVLMQRII